MGLSAVSSRFRAVFEVSFGEEAVEAVNLSLKATVAVLVRWDLRIMSLKTGVLGVKYLE
jgi:hypothetical protein